MKHRHHIIPKHMGGSDDEENLTPPISIQWHAKFHEDLYERFGLYEDFIAYKTLSGQMTISEASRLAYEHGVKKAGEKLAKRNSSMKNKTYEEIYGEERAQEIRENIRQSSLTREWSISDDERENRRKRAIDNNPSRSSEPEISNKISKALAKEIVLENKETKERITVVGLNRWAKENGLSPSYVKTRFRRNQDVMGWTRLQTPILLDR